MGMLIGWFVKTISLNPTPRLNDLAITDMAISIGFVVVVPVVVPITLAALIRVFVLM